MSAITLSGSNSYLISRELNRLIEAFTEQYGTIGIERLDAEELDAEEVLARSTSTSLFSLGKLIILKGVAKNLKLSDRIEDLIHLTGDDLQLIIVEPKIDKRSKLYSRLKRQTVFQDFSELSTDNLANWLASEAKLRGARLSRTDAKYLIDKAGPNQQLLANELDKLLLYDTEINKDIIDLLVEPSPQSDIFDLVKSVFARDRPRTLMLYEEQRSLGVDTKQIIGLLAWQLHLLAAVKAARDKSYDTIARDLGAKPRNIIEAARLTSGVSTSELDERVDKLLEIDLKIKTTPVDADDALLDWLLNY